MSIWLGNIPRQMKYVLVSSVLRYHLLRLKRPALMASATSENFECFIILPHVSWINSRRGIVRERVGVELKENVS
jgi:hypothetical protein